MWWRYFTCFRPEDPFEADTKRAIEKSRIEEEERIRRRKREEDEEIKIKRAKKESLKLAEREEEERRNRNREFEKKCKRKNEQLKHSKDDVGKEDVNGAPHSICNGCKFAIEDGISLDAFGVRWHPQCFCCLHCHKPIAECEILKKNQPKKHSIDDVEKEEEVNGAPPSICNGCKSAIEDGRSLDVFGALWHFQCFCCLHCHKPIAAKREILNSSKGKCHRPCNKGHRRPNCYVCDKKIPSTEEGIKYNEHPFWKEKYCPCHEDDGTAKCCSCERLESFGTKYVMLEDGRWLCRECMECAVMDTNECHILHLEIREFFKDLNMKVEKEFPVFLVEKEALNKAEEEEKIDSQYGVITRGICLSEEQTITKVSKGPRMAPDKKQLIGMVTEPQRVVGECQVTAILILYGLPRFLTGSILAHEMMHAYLRLNGYRKINEVLEEGLCQMLSHMWLEPQRYKTIDPAAIVDSSAASSSSCPLPPPAATTSKKGDQSSFEKKLVEFYNYQIETDESPTYGRGFKMVNQMVVSNHTLKDILREIQRRG